MRGFAAILFLLPVIFCNYHPTILRLARGPAHIKQTEVTQHLSLTPNPESETQLGKESDPLANRIDEILASLRMEDEESDESDD